MTNLLFVYGTLRRGFGRHFLLQRVRARYVGTGHAQGELFKLGQFPGAQRSKDPAARIVGEVYQLSNPVRAFRVLDRVEGFRPNAPAAGSFRRETATVVLDNGTRATAWVYWLNRAPGEFGRIESGDYALP